MMSLTFEPSVSIGNIISIMAFMVCGVGAYYRMGELARANTLFTRQLKERIDHCNVEQMKERVDTMWIIQMRRGMAELEKKELGYVSSPMVLTKRARDAIAPLVPELRKFYEAINGESLGLIELAVKIEEQFGERLSSTVCKLIGINGGACLVLAIAQLRPVGPEDITKSTEKNLGKVHASMRISQIAEPAV